jgi:hypothetical protein
MVVQEGVGGVLERNHAARKSNRPHRDPFSLDVAANAGSSSLPCGRDSPGRRVGEGPLPQQIGHSLPSRSPPPSRALLPLQETEELRGTRRLSALSQVLRRRGVARRGACWSSAGWCAGRPSLSEARHAREPGRRVGAFAMRRPSCSSTASPQDRAWTSLVTGSPSPPPSARHRTAGRVRHPARPARPVVGLA